MGVEFRAFRCGVNVRHRCQPLLPAIGSVFFQREIVIPRLKRVDLHLLALFFAFLLITAYSFKHQLTVQGPYGSRFQKKHPKYLQGTSLVSETEC